ncbi:unnamed protein product [Rotaria sordida]|uniref:F-box domain-containing protein n=2 Tax=Rotaria sordida TaxID=392033 RepID=A0A815LAN2_9BILA|nr:unnamed protein product [Rotaria sordida]CAF4137635.1 unnamed protein product [Rotaria sordida]
MDFNIHFEDLSNEIFFEIFDYLHALDIFTGFTSLNKRISSILESIPLRILNLYDHSRRQVDFISSHLTFHAHQVISINIYDKIRDYTSIIDLLFHRHNFTNLESCVLVANSSITKLENVIKRIKTLNKLVSFCICAPNDYNISTIDRSDLTRIMLMHKSSLHSIELHYRYDYMDIVSISTASINENDLPILPHVISFDFEILARCDSRSIGYILRSMPNLMYFYFLLTIEKGAWPFSGELLDGHAWQEMLESYVPHLSKFEFHMAIAKKYPRLNFDIVVNSFEYFVKKYFNWNITIDRWKFYCRPRGK